MIRKKMPTDKWWPILEMLNIPIEYIEKVGEFANSLALNEDVQYATLSGVGMGSVLPPSQLSNETKPEKEFQSLVPINLMVISKIKDLSKVEFMDAPVTSKMYRGESKTIQVGTLESKAKLVREDIFDVNNILSQYESLIVEEVALKINNFIDEGNIVYIYFPIQSIKLIAEKTMTPGINIISRLTYLKE